MLDFPASHPWLSQGIPNLPCLSMFMNGISTIHPYRWFVPLLYSHYSPKLVCVAYESLNLGATNQIPSISIITEDWNAWKPMQLPEHIAEAIFQRDQGTTAKPNIFVIFFLQNGLKQFNLPSINELTSSPASFGALEPDFPLEKQHFSGSNCELGWGQQMVINSCLTPQQSHTKPLIHQAALFDNSPPYGLSGGSQDFSATPVGDAMPSAAVAVECSLSRRWVGQKYIGSRSGSMHFNLHIYIYTHTHIYIYIHVQYIYIYIYMHAYICIYSFWII